MKRLFLIALLPLFTIVACRKDLTSLNVDPKNPQTAPSSAFFTSGQKAMTDLLTSTNVNDNIFRLIVQYWTETTYTDESNYDIVTRQIPRQIWNGLYRDVIRDFREAKKLIPSQVSNAGIQQNQLAITEIMEVMAWYYLVTTFGDIPYSEALEINTLQPKYDNQKTIYTDLLNRLNAAIADLDDASGSFGNADLVYGGDVEMWQKFANSFKVKMGMTIADDDNTLARSTVESAVAAGVFTSNADNAVFQYQTSPPNTNPVWTDLVQSGRKDFVVTNTIVNKMETLNDPRIDDFFSFDNTGSNYSGGIPGAGNNFATFSKPADAIQAPEFPALLLSYDEVEFFLAEAAQRGYNVGGTAIQHYNNAVTASIIYWGGTTTEATAYLLQPSVMYDPVNWKSRIGEQKWLALYNRGWDAWIEWRRLDAPAIVAPPTAVSATPLRYTYPIPEQNLNTANYNAASSAVGGDAVTTKLFWDKF
ncbi:MAG: SusD/RagB family nutrient-binding outer membrane lipoprotein [Flavisolibacter sp.]